MSDTRGTAGDRAGESAAEGPEPGASRRPKRGPALHLGSGSAPTLALAAVLLLGLWPLRGVLAAPATTLLGTSIDSVHHAWGLWHVASGSVNDTFWPVGAYGTVIGGPSVVIGALLTTTAGAPSAYTATCALQIVLTLLATGWLAVRLGGGPWSAPAAALLLLCGRPLLAQIGWGVPEGAAVGWGVLALVAGLTQTTVVPERAQSDASPWLSRLLARREAGPLLGITTGALLGASLVENPYTILPIALIAFAFAFVRLRRGAWGRLCGEAVGGATVLAMWAFFAHGEDGSLSTTAVGDTWRILGIPYVAEGPDGRAHLAGLLRGWEPLRYEGRLSELLATGAADMLGFLPVALAILAAIVSRRGRWLLAAAAALLSLALGSFPGGDTSGIPGPYLYGNLLLGLLVRPLTQPVRYLVMVGVALAVAGGLQVGRWAGQGRRRLVAATFALAVTEAILLGSPATRVPTFDLATWACLRDLPNGPVVTDVVIAPFETRGSTALAAQLVHGLPGTHEAIGGWTPRGERTGALGSALDGLRSPAVQVDVVRALRDQGVRTLLVAEGREGVSASTPTCGGVAVVDTAAIAGPLVKP